MWSSVTVYPRARYSSAKCSVQWTRSQNLMILRTFCPPTYSIFLHFFYLLLFFFHLFSFLSFFPFFSTFFCFSFFSVFPFFPRFPFFFLFSTFFFFFFSFSFYFLGCSKSDFFGLNCITISGTANQFRHRETLTGHRSVAHAKACVKIFINVPGPHTPFWQLPSQNPHSPVTSRSLSIKRCTRKHFS